jgi:DNA-binding response OmpR family regulator
MKVLIVDDEKMLADTIAEYLKKNRIFSDCVYNGEDAVEYALTGNYDLIILDIMLPLISGFEVMKILRQKNFTAPVLMLSAKSEISDKIDGLNIGADDYLTKPFAPGELLARVNALSRRKGEYTDDGAEFADLRLWQTAYELECNGTRISLSVKEYGIMETFMRNPKIIIPKERIMEKIWGFNTEAEYNSIEVYVSFLRKKLNALGSAVKIRAVRGVGYVLGEDNGR